jgi:hypothetical protein
MRECEDRKPRLADGYTETPVKRKERASFPLGKRQPEREFPGNSA